MAVDQSRRQTIFLTFKVLQFVNQLRRRIKRRILQESIEFGQLGIRLPLSHKHLGIIGRSSRSNAHDAKHSRHVIDRVRKSRKSQSKKRSLKLEFPRRAASATPNVHGEEVQHLFDSVDDALQSDGSSISAVARDDKLFLEYLKHSNSAILNGCSLNRIVQLLVTVQDALDVLAVCRQQYGDDWLFCQGQEAGLHLDEQFIANYEHLLLQLRAELIDALAHKALEELLHGSHDKKQRRMLGWFTEFAEKPRPLSTSFPWTIKPSLAVLWGVCWMFYDNVDAGNEQTGKVRVRLEHLAAELFPWNSPNSNDYVSLGRTMIGAHQNYDTQPNDNGLSMDTELSLYQMDVANRLPTGTGVHHQAVANGDLSSAVRSTHAFQGHSTYNLPSQLPYSIISPQFQSNPDLVVYPHLGSENHSDSWQNPYGSLPQQSPRHLVPPQPPSIQITGTEDQHFAQPQECLASFANIYPSSPRQLQASPLYLSTSFAFNQDQSNMGSNLSPDTTAFQGPPAAAKHERTSSMNSTTNMPTPVSISGPISPLRSPTSMEQPHFGTSPYHHSRHDSVESSEREMDDDLSSRKNYSYKRAEEPLRNHEGKMVCRHEECNGLFFDRKCEWSKHMDKHDRPYKCVAQGCEKLQGFTYSGGLLRHEREVHKMHGGTKKSLFCPFADCKRSSGSGFTRKENLAEHIRRVHRRTSMSADMHGLVIRRSNTMEGSPVAESRMTSESPYSRAVDLREQDEMVLKRKRGSDSGLSDRGHDEMRDEIKRLRQENEEKDSRLRQLEQAVMALQQSRR